MANYQSARTHSNEQCRELITQGLHYFWIKSQSDKVTQLHGRSQLGLVWHHRLSADPHRYDWKTKLFSTNEQKKSKSHTEPIFELFLVSFLPSTHSCTFEGRVCSFIFVWTNCNLHTCTWGRSSFSLYDDKTKLVPSVWGAHSTFMSMFVCIATKPAGRWRVSLCVKRLVSCIFLHRLKCKSSSLRMTLELHTVQSMTKDTHSARTVHVVFMCQNMI